MTLDQNLVTVQWSLVGAFGVAITLLASRAEQYRNDYLRTGETYDHVRAENWGILVRRTPLVVLAGVCGLSALGAQNARLRWTGKPSEEFWLLITPIIAQLGFVYLLARLVPKLPSAFHANLLAPPSTLPASRRSVTQTNITVNNDSAQPLLLWWLDTAGSPVGVESDGRPMRIPPGREGSQFSYDGHVFLIQILDGTNVGIVEAKESPTVVAVSQAAVNAALHNLHSSGDIP